MNVKVLAAAAFLALSPGCRAAEAERPSPRTAPPPPDAEPVASAPAKAASPLTPQASSPSPDAPPTSDVAEVVRAGFAVSSTPNPATLLVDAKVMSALMPVFESEDAYGNGPAWAALVEYLASTDSALRGLELDDESSALLVRSPDRKVLEHLRQRLVDLASDPAALRAAIRQARAKGFGHGDL